MPLHTLSNGPNSCFGRVDPLFCKRGSDQLKKGTMLMPATLLDGKQLAQTMQMEIAAEAAAFANKMHGFRPGLAAVLVGDDPASHIYVRNKRKACQQAGLVSWLHEL